MDGTAALGGLAHAVPLTRVHEVEAKSQELIGETSRLVETLKSAEREPAAGSK
jgi:hypothetical protein